MSARIDSNRPDRQPRRAWQRPTLTSVGTVADVVQGGNGKLTVITGDPGEPQKVPAMDT
jgi:hypothetical protein